MENPTHAQARKKNEKERIKRYRAGETEAEAVARLNQMRKKWAESDYAAKRKSKRAKTRMRESRKDTLIRKEAESLRNSPDRRNRCTIHIDAISEKRRRRKREM